MPPYRSLTHFNRHLTPLCRPSLPYHHPLMPPTLLHHPLKPGHRHLTLFRRLFIIPLHILPNPVAFTFRHPLTRLVVL